MLVCAGVLFDVGYCLMDESRRLDHALRWLSEALAGAGQPRTVAALDTAYLTACRRPAPGEPSLLVQMLRDLGVPEETAVPLRRALPWDAVPLDAYPDAVPALGTLRAAGFRLGVLANQPASALADLDRAGLAPLCDGVWLSGAVGMTKPDPAFFRVALDAWALPAGRIAYVGDRPDNDVAPARRLGLVTLRLYRGPHAAQLASTAAERPDLEAQDLGEAAERLAAWGAALGGA